MKHYLHGGIVDGIDLVADENDGRVVVGAESGADDGEPVERDTVQRLLVLDVVHDANHVRELHLATKVVLALLALCVHNESRRLLLLLLLLEAEGYLN